MSRRAEILTRGARSAGLQLLSAHAALAHGDMARAQAHALTSLATAAHALLTELAADEEDRSGE